jgi:hypothetical protein
MNHAEWLNNQKFPFFIVISNYNKFYFRVFLSIFTNFNLGKIYKEGIEIKKADYYPPYPKFL